MVAVAESSPLHRFHFQPLRSRCLHRRFQQRHRHPGCADASGLVAQLAPRACRELRVGEGGGLLQLRGHAAAF
jgi:hypothetical protein